MKFHIVQMNETIDKIAFLYNLNNYELIEENKHIKNWNKLIPGTKLKIPVVTEAIEREISEMEPFIEDYYPKIANKLNLEELNSQEVLEDKTLKEEKKEPIELKEEKIETKKEEVIENKTTESFRRKSCGCSKRYYNPYNYYREIRMYYPYYIYYPVYKKKPRV